MARIPYRLISPTLYSNRLVIGSTHHGKSSAEIYAICEALSDGAAAIDVDPLSRFADRIRAALSDESDESSGSEK